MINSFRNEYAFLSNMFPCNVHGYTCAEAAFQAAKCEDKAVRAQFKALDGKEAKALGRKVQLRSDWNTFRTQAMYAAVKCKFTENPELGKKLVATGNEELAEGNDWGDKFWGVCDGEGQNMLGKILMKVRGELGGKGIVHKEDAKMNNSKTREVKYEDVKGMSFYMFETLSKLAQGMYTEEELKARREKGKATTLMQAVAEMIVPDKGLKGAYRCYSQRAFDQGNSGDPYEYTGVQISFKLKNGMYITVDTHYGNIQVSYKDMKHSMGIGQKLMSELDKIGEALWADWDDNPDSITKKLRDVEDEETWLESNEDYKYNEARIWSRPTDERNYSKLESEFERDVRGGIKYTTREEDPVAGRYFNYKARQDYKDIIAEQKRKFAESAKRQMYPIKPLAPANA